VLTLFFRHGVDFSSFFSLFSTPQKDPQNGLKMVSESVTLGASN
jgi:hypothetical protein